MENKQTERIAEGGKTMSSIDWLEEKWFSGDFLGEADFQQAKEKHKQEIIDAATWGYNSRSGEQYYNETYGKE